MATGHDKLPSLHAQRHTIASKFRSLALQTQSLPTRGVIFYDTGERYSTRISPATRLCSEPCQSISIGCRLWSPSPSTPGGLASNGLHAQHTGRTCCIFAAWQVFWGRHGGLLLAVYLRCSAPTGIVAEAL